MAKRLTRARRMIREAGIPFRAPRPQDLPDRLDAVLRVIYLIFTEGHKSSATARLIRENLCDAAIRLSRTVHGLLPDEPEAAGLLALLLLTDARRPARVDAAGNQVLLQDQDRTRWNLTMIEEGEALLERALTAGRPGAYQLHAAIAACHCTAAHATATDWRQICLLYAELLRYEPTPVVLANRAVAVAMADGPAAGLAILDSLSSHRHLRRWAPIHLARADLLHRLGRDTDAGAVYETALELSPSPAERAFILRRLQQLRPKAPAGSPGPAAEPGTRATGSKPRTPTSSGARAAGPVTRVDRITSP